MKPECLGTRQMKSGKRRGQIFAVVHEHMVSLQQYGFEKYADYSERERDMYRPGTSWELLVPGSKTKRRRIAV